MEMVKTTVKQCVPGRVLLYLYQLTAESIFTHEKKSKIEAETPKSSICTSKKHEQK